MKGVSEHWPLVLTAAGDPGEKARVNIAGGLSPRQPCYLCGQNLVAGEEVIKKWVTAEGCLTKDQGPSPSGSGFREGFCGS